MKDINQGIAIWRKTWDGINFSCIIGLLLVAVLGTLGSPIAVLCIKKLPALIHLPLVILTKFLFDAVWGLILGDLKAVRLVGGVSQVDDSAVSEPLFNLR